jgi:hypothetical protein
LIDGRLAALLVNVVRRAVAPDPASRDHFT